EPALPPPRRLPGPGLGPSLVRGGRRTGLEPAPPANGTARPQRRTSRRGGPISRQPPPGRRTKGGRRARHRADPGLSTPQAGNLMTGRPFGGLLRHRDFRLLWLGETTNGLGAAVSTVAIPLVAVTTLHAN